MGDQDVCACGHIRDEHGEACQGPDCPCILFDFDPDLNLYDSDTSEPCGPDDALSPKPEGEK